MSAELYNSNSSLHGATFDDYLAAGRADTPGLMIFLLSLSPIERIRERVAENPFASQSVLQTLSKDTSAQVREAVAHNPKTSWVVLASLARDNNPDVRFAMAENPHLPLHVLNILAADENPYVRERARNTIADMEIDKQRRPKNTLINRIKLCSDGREPATA